LGWKNNLREIYYVMAGICRFSASPDFDSMERLKKPIKKFSRRYFKVITSTNPISQEELPIPICLELGDACPELGTQVG